MENPWSWERCPTHPAALQLLGKVQTPGPGRDCHLRLFKGFPQEGPESAVSAVSRVPATVEGVERRIWETRPSSKRAQGLGL